ncbi:MAG TPA: hypothetical protein VF145_03230 [Chitinophagaceae bacterium]
MNKLEDLRTLRNQYIQLTKLFFLELQRGGSAEDLADLRSRIDALIVEINHLEHELNIHNGNPGQG